MTLYLINLINYCIAREKLLEHVLIIGKGKLLDGALIIGRGEASSNLIFILLGRSF